MNKIVVARELVKLAKELTAVSLKLEVQPKRTSKSETMWVAKDENGNAHGFITKIPNSRTDLHPFKVFVYPKPLKPGETAWDNDMLGAEYKQGKAGLAKAFERLKAGKKFETEPERK